MESMKLWKRVNMNAWKYGNALLGILGCSFAYSAMPAAICLGVENYVNSTAPRSSIKVGSYNIRLSGVDGSADRGTPNAWKERKEDLVDLIWKLDLDVFGLQEVCPDQAAFLREKLSSYGFIGEHRGADRVSDEASPVCYRKSRFDVVDKGTFWLSELLG